MKRESGWPHAPCATVRFDGNDHLLFLIQPRVYRVDLKTEKVQPFLSSPRVA